MKQKIFYLFVIVGCWVYQKNFAQPAAIAPQHDAGWFSLGGRNTLSAFAHDGTGLGTGGEFRLQLSDNVNTEWFADYITINVKDRVRSEYYHIGWSVLYYPFPKMRYPKLFRPYVLAGHCFDYNVKSVIQEPSTSKKRWGSAIQAGFGTHLSLSERFDLSFTCQYMIHLTKELEAEIGDEVKISEYSHPSLEGHLLNTLGINYKIIRLWKKG